MTLSASSSDFRVLLVDDVPEVRRLVRTALRFRGGFDVVGEASTGVAAVTLVEELQPLTWSCSTWVCPTSPGATC